LNGKVNIVFVADAKAISIEVKNIDKGLEIKMNIKNALLKHFNDKGLFILARNESKIKEILNTIIQEQKSIIPQIQKLSKFINQLEENEHFIFLKGNEFSLEFFNKLYHKCPK